MSIFLKIFKKTASETVRRETITIESRQRTVVRWSSHSPNADEVISAIQEKVNAERLLHNASETSKGSEQS